MAQQLTDREYQVLRLMFCGLTNREIATELCVTVKTVEYHIANILGKVGAANRTQAVVIALQQGLVDPEDLEWQSGPEDTRDLGNP